MRLLRTIVIKRLRWNVSRQGLRINSASDDAAGLAISSRMQAEVSGLNMATRNANDAISMIETIEGSSREIATALQRMRELRSSGGIRHLRGDGQGCVGPGIWSVVSEMQRIATQTTWNEITVMDGNGVSSCRGQLPHIINHPAR